MGALFMLLGLFVLFGAVYPAIMAGVWVIERAAGSREAFRHFMDRT